MKKNHSSWKIGLLSSIFSFFALTFLTGSLIEVSQDIDIWRRLGETMLYALGNKLTEKIIAAMAIGALAAFVTHMINYGKAVKNHRRGRTTSLHFSQDDTGTTRTA